MHSPLCTSHQRNAPSPPPLISTPPLESHASAYVIPPRPLKMDSRSPLCASQTMISPLPWPPPTLASRVPSGLQATLSTMPLCPWSETRRWPSEASHRQTLPSSLQLTNCVPSRLHSILRMMVGGVSLTKWQVPVATSHTYTPR